MRPALLVVKKTRLKWLIQVKKSYQLSTLTTTSNKFRNQREYQPRKPFSRQEGGENQQDIITKLNSMSEKDLRNDTTLVRTLDSLSRINNPELHQERNDWIKKLLTLCSTSNHVKLTSRNCSNLCFSMVKGDFFRVDRNLCISYLNTTNSMDFSKFDSNSLSKLVWSLSKLKYTTPLPQVLKEIHSRGLKTFTSQGIGNLIYSLAIMRMKEETGLLEEISMEIENRGLGSFTSQEITNVIWGFATLKVKNCEGIVKNVSKEIHSRGFSTFSSQGLSNVLWGMAVLNGKSEKSLFRLASDEILSRNLMTEFNTRDICNIVWSFATLGFECNELLQAISTEVKRNCSQFNARDLSNLIWGYATLQNRDVSLFSGTVVKELQNRSLKDFSPRDISNLLWGYATLNIYDVGLIKLIVQEITTNPNRDMKAFNPQDICNLFWSFATLKIQEDPQFNTKYTPFLNIFAKEILLSGLKKYKPQEISNLMWSYASFGIKNDELIDLVSKEIQLHRGGLTSFKPLEINSLLWSFVKFNRPKDIIAQGYSSYVFKNYKNTMSSNLILSYFWCFACANLLTHPNVKELTEFLFKRHSLGEINLEIPEKERNEEVAVQLYHTHIASRQQEPQEPQGNIFEIMNKNNWIREYVTNANKSIKSSKVHLEILENMKKLNKDDLVELQTEFITPIGISVDIFLPKQNLVVEVDGYWHFLADGKTPTGATLFKRTILEREGYLVKAINVGEWTLLKTSMEKKEFLLTLLGI